RPFWNLTLPTFRRFSLTFGRNESHVNFLILTWFVLCFVAKKLDNIAGYVVSMTLDRKLEVLPHIIKKASFSVELKI
ncbi:hypothetical protein, partial [Phormidium sp. CCY1219]|uniref:hypothetical protein n=1 Tax=Phormidium sp. CCY1219 TaxID=2886104 RepID=UPI002D1F6301